MSTDSYPLTDEQIATYLKDGAICLRQVFNPDDVQALRAAVDEAMSRPGPCATDFSDGTGGKFFADVFLWTRIDRIREIALSQRVGEIAGRLMGAHEVRFFFDHLLVKEPGSTAPTPWHQDAPYWPIEGEQCLSLWIALDPVSKANGLVEYAKGTHQSGKLFASESFRGEGRLTSEAYKGAVDELDDLPDIEANRAGYDIISWDLEPGDVAVHHFRTIHGAPGNLTTATRRRGLATRFIGEDIVYKARPGVPKPMSDSLAQLAPDLADGDRFVEPTFPMVWAAAGASLVA